MCKTGDDIRMSGEGTTGLSQTERLKARIIIYLERWLPLRKASISSTKK